MGSFTYHEAQFSRGTKRRGNEEQTSAKHTLLIKLPTYQQRTVAEELP